MAKAGIGTDRRLREPPEGEKEPGIDRVAEDGRRSLRSNNPPVHGDEPPYETVVMRRFHLTPGESEYVFVKRRLAVLPFKDRVEPERAKSRNEKGVGVPAIAATFRIDETPPQFLSRE